MKVFFESGFWHHHGHDHAGKEITIKKEFSWAGFTWMVPSVYLCGKGLVVDICRRVEVKAMTDFMTKWNLTPENEEERRFTRQEMQQLTRENPMNFDMRMKITVNGKELEQAHGYGTSYQACLEEAELCNAESEAVIWHYGLDASCCWSIWRWCFAWNTKRKPDIKSMEMTMIQERVAVPGITFSVSGAGDTVDFTYPEGGNNYVLTVQEYEQSEFPAERLGDSEFENPTHYHAMMYQVTPELPKGLLQISDADEGDRPRRKPCKTDEEFGPTAAASIALIGGADGPTALFIGSSKPQVAFSSLRFEPVESVTWQMTFYEKQTENETMVLIEKP